MRDHVNANEEKNLEYDAAENSESVKVAKIPPCLNPTDDSAQGDEHCNNADGDGEYAAEKSSFGNVFQDRGDEKVFVHWYGLQGVRENA